MEDEEDVRSMFQGMMDRFRGRRHQRGGPHHRRGPPSDEDEEEEGERFRGHHQRGHHGRKDHQGPPRVQGDENDMVIIAGTPVKASVAEKFYNHQMDKVDEYEKQRFHGRHGYHGKHPKNKRCCKLVKLVLGLVFAAHFWFIRKLMKAQEALETLTGKKDEGHSKCAWKKNFNKHFAHFAQFAQQQVQQPAQQPAQQPSQQPQTIYVQQPIVEYSGINSSESSIDTEAPIYEERDKEMGYTFSPAPVATTITLKNNMI